MIILRSFALLVAFAVSASNADAQNYPSRTLRLVVPYATGGPTDLLARALAQRMQEKFSQPVVVDNRPGAGGIIGVDHVAKAEPDGYTLLFTASGTLVINPALNPNLPYRAADLAPVSSAASYAMFLSVNAKLPFANIGELIAFAKANPGKLSFGSAGPGTSNHLAGELLRNMAAIDLTHVPYRGNAAAMTDVIAGNISMMFDLPATTLPHAQAGTVKLLGTTGEHASRLAPDVPAITGTVRGYEVLSWFGVFAPAKTPADIIQKLNQQIVLILADPAVSGRLIEQGYDVAGSTPEALAARIRTDTKLWADLIRDAKIKAE